MKRQSTKVFNARRASVALACLLALASMPVSAITPSSFAPVEAQLTDDIATLSAIPVPSHAERALLKKLGKGTNILAKTSLDDGKALGKLNTLLKRIPAYATPLEMVTSNLMVTFEVEYDFVGNTLLPEVPPSPDVAIVTAQYNKLAPVAEKLRTSPTVAKCAARYDSAKRKLDNVFFAANQLLNFPFPSDLETNSVVAKINGQGFRTSSALATDNSFQAIATDSNVTIIVSALVTISGHPNGILFSVPNAQLGTFRYNVPDAASFTNRTDVYDTEHESNVAATNGMIFVSTTATEAYGIFQCSGPGFNVTEGRFRITISRQP